MEQALMLADPIVSAALAACFAMILFAAAWHKLTEPLMFEAALVAYKLAPGSATALLARALPAAEVAIALGLLWPVTRSMALIAFAALMLVYAAAMAINLLRGRSQIDCGCGADVHLLSWALVARNAVLALIAFLTSPPGVARELQWLDAVTLIAGALACYAAYLLCDELLRQHGRILQLRKQKVAG